MDNVPQYVSAIFMVTTFVTVLIFLYAVKRNSADSFTGKAVLFFISFWLMLQAALAIGGTYVTTPASPPLLFFLGPIPMLLSIIAVFIFARPFVANLPLRLLTLIHVIRIPVELVLHWLSEAGVVPEVMTFYGRNFDILSGITAPLVYLLAFRGNTVNRGLLLGWNLVALAFVVNIVVTAILAFPSPLQAIAFDQPNRAVMYFPYAWLPSLVVPIVLFCHFASIYKLWTNNTR